MTANVLSRIFTIEIGDTPTLTFEAQNLREAQELCHEQWRKDERPRCPKCTNRMSLARIMPGPPGFDLRNFECEKCIHVITVTVATDPMKSDKVGWMAGELKPPE